MDTISLEGATVPGCKPGFNASECAARVTVHRLQHVSTPYPRGRQDDVRAFYSGVLGLVEKPVPDSLVHMELVWFEAGAAQVELHFLPDPVQPDATAQRHFCLEVDDVEAWRRRLEAKGVATSEDVPIPNRPRFFCRDPFGNLIEFTTIEGDYR
jgi:catechol 2,3-dioxygenase-like lactoylglutathione lyase family enzyme